MDWDHILDQTAPFVPQPDDACDTTYFDTRYIKPGRDALGFLYLNLMVQNSKNSKLTELSFYRQKSIKQKRLKNYMKI